MLEQDLGQLILEYLETTAKAAGFGEARGLAEIIGGLIGVALSLLGVIFLILIIYGGFVWMTAAGNEQKILKAKKIITNAVIGTAIAMSAYAITLFVFKSLATALE